MSVLLALKGVLQNYAILKTIYTPPIYKLLIILG